MPPRALSDLAKPEFERLVSRLYWTTLSGCGAFWPNPTGTGRTDGGFDARFRGEYGGRDDTWRVSAKHTLAQDPVKALQDLLRDELRRYPREAWIVVTNAHLDPQEQDRLVNWAKRRDVRAIHVDDGNVVAGLLDLHPYVGRLFGLAPDSLVLRALPDPRPVPRTWDAVVTSLLAESARGWIGIRAEDGMGHDLVLSAVGHELAGVDGARFPLWLDASDPSQAAALGRELAELPREASRYVFLVPREARWALRHLRSFVDAGDHAVVFACAPSDPRAPRATYQDLDAPDDASMREWLSRMWPNARIDLHAQLFALCDTRPGECVDWVTGHLPQVAERVSRLLEDESCGGDLRRIQAREILALLVLALPFSDASLDVEWIAGVCGTDAHEVRRLAHHAARLGLIRDDGKRFHEVSQVQSAAVLDLCRLHRGCTSRLNERPDLAARLAQLADDEAPLLTVLRHDRDEVLRGGYIEAHRAIDRAIRVAEWSEAIADVVLEIGRAALRRADEPDPFPGIPYLPGDRAAAHLRHDAVRVLSSVAGRPNAMPRALSTLLDLARAGASVRWGDVAARIAAPLHRDGRAAAAFEQISGMVREDRDALELVVETCKLWVNSAVEVRGSFRSTFTFGKNLWNELSPVVAARRADALRVLWSMVKSSSTPTRVAGWAAWGHVWHGHPDSKGSMPPLFVDAVHELLDYASVRLAQTETWPELEKIETLVIGWCAHPEIERARIAATVRCFRTDPLYRAWRLLAAPAHFILSPSSLADAMEAGASWRTVVEVTGGVGLGLAAAKAVAGRLVDAAPEPAQLFRLLSETVVRRADGGWGQIGVLEAWVERDPEWFEPLMTGMTWAEVPRPARGLLLDAARPVFGAALARDVFALPPPTVGAAADLAQLVHRPVEVNPADVHTLLQALAAMLPMVRRLEVLPGLAAHGDATVRERVLVRLTQDLLYATPPADPYASAAVLRALLPAGRIQPADGILVRRLFTALRYVPDDQQGRADQFLGACADVLLERIDDIPGDEDDVLERFVAQAWMSWPDACFAAVRRAAARASRSALGARHLAPELAEQVLERVLVELATEDDEDFWAELVSELATPLEPAQVVRLVRAAPARAGLLLLANREVQGDDSYLDLLSERLAAADPTDRAVLVAGVCRSSVRTIQLRPESRRLATVDEPRTVELIGRIRRYAERGAGAAREGLLELVETMERVSRGPAA